jgi:Methylase involved in ubiquinone/menaquinone biosynthesis
MSGNENQREFWNGPVAQNWVDRQAHFERGFTEITAALMEFAAPQKGEAVLDIGCGAGFTTDALARLVAPGPVTGLDISAVFTGAAAKLYGDHARFIEADASVYPFQPEFDLLFSRLGVMFFADPVQSFANLHRALKPSGRLAFLCWCPMADIPSLIEPYEAARHLLPPVDPTPENTPGPFGLADSARTRRILQDAGWQDIHIEKARPRSLLGTTLDEAIDQTLNLGPLARQTRELDDDAKARVREAIAPVLARYQTDDGIAPPSAVWLVSAR